MSQLYKDRLILYSLLPYLLCISYVQYGVDPKDNFSRQLTSWVQKIPKFLFDGKLLIPDSRSRIHRVSNECSQWYSIYQQQSCGGVYSMTASSEYIKKCHTIVCCTAEGHQRPTDACPVALRRQSCRSLTAL